ncbi:MAG TPA: DUF5916 domain-containing protein [Gemmatimonadaceae bacterium]|nr:DUF5916 domain-containing protein [Gemmatimonadaceae bacterium]
MIPALFLLALQAQPQTAVEGRGRPTFVVPRVEAEVAVDADLAEPAWQRAVRLTGFSQYGPVDGRPAEERTEVLVFYSARAIHFGIIAHAKDPASIRATIADRDRIGSDDRVTLYLDTFDDRRRAFIFGVNPLGVQEDGVRTEGAVSAGSIFGGSVDHNPDYLFESKGRVTREGYVVEVSIPFKSLRFPGSGPQRWGINVVRNVASTGREDTWTDARRASASFLAQSGAMTGIEDVERGVVTEVQPFVTASTSRFRPSAADRFERDPMRPDAGANLRLGFPELSLDATINPDFSQVESDAGVVTVNERFALFIPEKRPFFLEGIELFSTPNHLVYTRRVVQPLAGAKLTGKLGRYSVAYLSAVDEASGTDALFNVARLKADFGGSSLAGLTLTDRRRGGEFNTIAAADVNYVFAKLYYFEPQVGVSWTRRPGDVAARPAKLWKLELDRTGRAWGFNYRLNAIEDGFESHAGFVPRADMVDGHFYNRFSLYGPRGALVENFTFFFGPARIWSWADFPRRSPVEGNDLLGGFVVLRGGWRVNWGAYRALVHFDPRLFDGVQTRNPDGTFAAYQGARSLTDLWGDSLGIQAPVYQGFTAAAGAARQRIPIFLEGSEGIETRSNASVTLRPTASLRVEGGVVWARIERARDGSEFGEAVIPRIKVEYQPTRALFFRAVTQWQKERQDVLRDASTGAPLYLGGDPLAAIDRGPLRADWLVAYQPTPGTAAFLGYGSSLEPLSGSRLSGLRTTSDGVFAKVAYLFRR